MFVTFRAPVNTDLNSKSLPNGNWIRGIVINNPTGGWLYVVSEQQWVPPYTNGWSMPTTYDQASITVQYKLTGPAGQIGTVQATETWELEIHDEATDSSSGGPTSQFIEQFTPILTAGTGGSILVPWNAGLTVPLITGVANKRTRLLTIDISIGGFPGGGHIDWDITGTGVITPPPLIQGVVTDYNKPADHREYPAGIDFPLGANIQADFIAGNGFCSCDVTLEISYQTI